MNRIGMLLIVMTIVIGCEKERVMVESITIKGNTYYANGGVEPFTGIVVDINENGAVSRERETKNGKLHGTDTEYFDNGSVSSVTQYHSGKKNGIEFRLNQKGDTLAVQHFLDGRAEGLIREWDSQDLSLVREVLIKDGVEIYSKQFSHGGVKQSYMYLDTATGLFTSLAYEYGTGILVDSSVYDTKAEQTVFDCKFDNGEMIEYRNFKDGRMHGKYKDDKSYGNYVHGLKDGKWHEKRGTTQVDCSYDNRFVLNGESIYTGKYFKYKVSNGDTTVLEIGQYKDGYQEGEWVEHDRWASSDTKKVRTYAKGILHGAYSYYSNEAKEGRPPKYVLREKGQYKDGKRVK